MSIYLFYIETFNINIYEEVYISGCLIFFKYEPGHAILRNQFKKNWIDYGTL